MLIILFSNSVFNLNLYLSWNSYLQKDFLLLKLADCVVISWANEVYYEILNIEPCWNNWLHLELLISTVWWKDLQENAQSFLRLKSYIHIFLVWLFSFHISVPFTGGVVPAVWLRGQIHLYFTHPRRASDLLALQFHKVFPFCRRHAGKIFVKLREDPPHSPCLLLRHLAVVGICTLEGLLF